MYRVSIVKELITLSVLIAFSLLPAQDFPDEFFNGQIKTVDSRILQQERKIFIYLPTDYGDTNEKYPVHYVTDAPATANLYHDIMKLHTLVNAMPQCIVVGLSSDDREHHMHPKGAKHYMDFLLKEIVPFVDNHYRTYPFRAIAGHSLGGGFAIYTFLSNIENFNACIAGSPYPLEFLSNQGFPPDLFTNLSDYRFFFSSIGTEKDVSELHFKQFQNALVEKAPQNLEYSFTIHDGEDHISNIALNFQNGLKALYSDWKFVLPDTLNMPIDRLLAAHYYKLSRKMGYTVKPVQWKVLFPIMDSLARQGDFKSVIRLLTYCISLYPQSDQAYAFLARAHMSTGKIDSAKANVDKALSINPNNSYALELKEKLKN